jgi:small subunit ribosomal protein S6
VTEQRINAYEGLFLFPQAVAGELQFAVDHIIEILAKSNAEIISLCKWDERRLAYEIKGNKRGIYFLVYFRANRTDLVSIERSCNLSETLLRSMMVRTDHLTKEQMESADGTAQIADEIKLRAEQAVAAPEAAPVVESPDKAAEPVAAEPVAAGTKGEETPAVTVETEVTPSDAATT